MWKAGDILSWMQTIQKQPSPPNAVEIPPRFHCCEEYEKMAGVYQTIKKLPAPNHKLSCRKLVCKKQEKELRSLAAPGMNNYLYNPILKTSAIRIRIQPVANLEIVTAAIPT